MNKAFTSCSGAMGVITPLILLFIFQGEVVEGQKGHDIVINGGVYTFQNANDLGFLTSVRGRPGKENFAITDKWRDAPAQKFRANKGYWQSTFMFKPTSAESQAIYVSGDEIRQSYSRFGLSSSQYWTVVHAEGQLYLIKNSQNNHCLTSRGFGKQLRTEVCSNIRDQQWAIHRR